ncbi:MAG: 3'-5' exonuclease, partial [Planktothrix sp.]
AVVAELRSRLSSLLRDLGYASSYNSLKIYTFHGYVRRTLGDRLPKECELEEYPTEYLKITRTNKSLLRPNGREAPHYIFIDEYQDINKERYQMLLRIKGDNTHLIAIGDDDQSIYGYERKKTLASMSSAPYFKRFKTDFKAQGHNLTINYRSGSEILEKAEKYILKNGDRLREARLKPGRNDITGEFITSEFNPDNSIQQILDIISDILNHRKFDSIAVLFRTNAELYRILGTLQHRFQDQAQIRVQGGKERFAALRQIAVFLDQLKPVCDRKIGSFDIDFLTYIQNTCISLCQSHPIFNDNYYDLLEAVAWSFEDNASRNSTVAEFIEYIEDMRDISELLILYKNYKKWRDSVGIIKNFKPIITMSTIHKIKGLEFDAVVIPSADCVQNISGKEAIEEQRRLRYVGMTRARDYLHLIVGPREIQLYDSKDIRKQENPQIGYKFDSGDCYSAKNGESPKGPITLFKFAQNDYAKNYTNYRETQGTGQGLQKLIFSKIGEGDELELRLDVESYSSYHYHLYHRNLRTNIGRLTSEESQKIYEWFYKKKLPFNSLGGLRVTSISRFPVPKQGEKGYELNTMLCEFVKKQGYYYLVNCAGYLQSSNQDKNEKPRF